MSTVRVLSTSRAAISRLVRPCATRRTTSTSRRESPRGLVLGGGAPAEVVGDRRAERGDGRGRLGRQRPGAQRRSPSGGPRRAGRARRRARRSRRAPRRRAPGSAPARTGCSARRAARPRARTVPTAASASPSASAVSAIAQASAASASSCWADAAIDESASVHARASARRPVPGEPARRPAQAPDRVVMVLAALPAREDGSAVLLGSLRVALAGGEPGQRRRAVALHRDHVQPRRRLVAARQQRHAAPAVSAPHLDRAEDAVGDERLLRRARRARSGPAQSSSAWSHSPSSRRT